MTKRTISKALFLSLAMLGTTSLAMAQDGPEPVAPESEGDVDDDLPEDSGSVNDMSAPLPESASDDDKAPPVASPGTPDGMIVKQAGVGGRMGYGRAGVLELGGSAGFVAGQDFTQVNLTPSIGWFVADNLQLSGRLSLTYVDTGSDSGSITSALVEPSYHLPFNRKTFGFLGIGMGAAHVSKLGLGFAMAPRLGANFMIGRSGVLTPALSYQYTTHDAMTDSTTGNEVVSVLVVSQAVSANIGYTVMW